MRSVIFSRQRECKNGSDATRLGIFDNSTFKRVPNMLKVDYLRLWKVAVKRIIVVKLGG